MIRPGPEMIDPATVPGGVVLHVYSIPDERLLIVQYLTPDSDIARQAHHGADVCAAEADAVCLVAYDGDTGQRLSITEATAPL